MPLTVFGAQGATNDVELWGTDGTTGRTYLIKNINPTGSANVGNASTNYSIGNLPFAVIGNYAYFTATDGSTGQELWRTDGTTAGTTKVTEFSTNGGTGDPFDDVSGYNPQNIVAANGYIFFVGSGPAAVNPATSPARYGIWRYDPVSNTTAFIADNEGIGSMIAAGGRVYWTYDGGSGSGLKSSDGVGAVESHYSLGFSGAPGALYEVGGTVYLGYNGGTKQVVGITEANVTGGPTSVSGFVATSTHVYIIGGQNNSLYVTTTATTTASQITMAGLTFDFQFSPGYHTPGFAALGDKLIFSNNITSGSGVGASTGSEVWITDGTAAGTVVLKDIVAGIGSSNPHNFITVGSSVFFQATNGNGSVELWKTDGTGAGTVLVETLFAGGLSSGTGQIAPPGNLDNMEVINGVLFFSFDNGTHGTELWRSDGTALGTTMIKDLNSVPIDTGYSTNFPSAGVSLGGTGVFVGWSQATGYELFVTNGTAAGTSLLKDIAPGGGNSLPTQFVLAGTKAYFSAFSPTTGTELWVTDGTVNGTFMVKDINVGLASGNPSGMVAVGNKIYFSADNGVNGQELWVSDGTAAGTVLLKDIDPTSSGGYPRSGGPYGFVVAGSKVFFTAATNASGRELWVTDGTAAGTVLTKEIGPGAADANIYSNVVAYNNKVYFQASDGTNGTELWVSDGTNAGTFMLKDINTTGPGESSSPSDFVTANGLLFFRANGLNPFAGAEIYASDGTVPGTVALSPTLTNFSQFAVANNKVFFTAQGADGQELYVTSGAAVTVIDIVAGASGSNATGVVAFGTKVLFTAANTVSNGQELWISDGTLAGTSMLKNINPGANASSNPQYITVVGNKAYFVASDGTNGRELWVTDGTLAGTHMVKNIGAGMTDGSVNPLRAADNGHLLFLANDGTGQELWITNGTEAGTFRATDVVQPGVSFYGGSGGSLNGGGAPGGTFTSVPGVTLGSGDETFLGTVDNDYFEGLGGNDVFHVNSPGDVVREAAASGTDTVYASASYTLTAGAHVETLSTVALGATTAINLSGNELAQVIYGNAGVNNINGGGGNDTLFGLGGNDILNGSTGNDTMNGGAGNDVHYVDAAGDVIQEAAASGTDTVYTSVSYTLTAGAEVETLSTSSLGAVTAINLTGNAFGQVIYGNAGANVINGLGGNDTMIGLGGNDTYYVDAAGDVIQEAAAAGSDVVYASASYTLTAGAHVETLSTSALGAVTAINLSGNEQAQTIYGNAGVNNINGGGGNDTLLGLGGNDVLNGSTGNDTMNGGAGNDTFHVDAAGDVIQEAAAGGTDTVYASVSYALTAGAEVETLSTSSLGAVTAINLTGNATAQTIYGNAGANVLNGLGGNDTLIGLGGADIFAFTTALGAGNVDTISGYSVADDTIRLENAVFTGLAAGALAAGAFNTGAAATQADDRIIYNSATGALLFDSDGVGGAAAVQFAALSAGLAMTAGEFVVI